MILNPVFNELFGVIDMLMFQLSEQPLIVVSFLRGNNMQSEQLSQTFD